MPEPSQQHSKRGQDDSNAAGGARRGNQHSPIWRSGLSGKLFALVCLTVAVAVEWKLVNLPAGEVSGQFPTTVRARNEIITFTDPGSVTGGTFSFMYAPPTEAERVLLDAYFDNAQLSSQTLQALKSFQISAPMSPGVITYLTSGSGNAACATELQGEPTHNNLKSVELWPGG